MMVHDLSRAECDAVLARATIARIACVRDGEPYIVPIHVAFDGEALFWMPGVAKSPSRERVTPVVYRIRIARVTGRTMPHAQ